MRNSTDLAPYVEACSASLADLNFTKRNHRFWYIGAAGAMVHLRFIAIPGDEPWFVVQRAFLPAAEVQAMITAGRRVPFPEKQIAWFFVDASPQCAIDAFRGRGDWDASKVNIFGELNRVVSGVASVLVEWANRGVRPKRDGVFVDSTVGVFGMPTYGIAGWVKSMLSTNANRDDLRVKVEQLDLTYPGNEWVAYWRSVLFV